MARRYDLGSVVGEIKFTYDKNGVLRARDDMGRFVKDSDDAGDHFDLFSRRSVAAAGKVASAVTAMFLAMAAGGAAVNLINTLGVALVQLSQAAVLLPGALAGLAAVAGTVALGVDGIKKAFEGMKPTLDKLKSQVSDAFEKSLAPAVKNLNNLLPQLTTGFRNIATAMGDSATKFTAVLNQGSSVKALNNILNQTATITRNVGAAAGPVVQAFLNIASIGISFITPMTKGLEALAQRFAAWTQSAEGQAKINDMIKTGIEAFKVLGGIIVQIGGIIGAIFNGLSTSTGNFGSSIVETLRSVNAFLSGVEGFNALQAIGQTLQEVGTVVRTVLLTALRELAPSIPPLMKALSELAQQILPPLVTILEVAGPVIFKIAEAIADNINWIGPLIIALGAWAAAQWALNIAMDANPIGLVILAIAALVAAAALIITNWDTIVAFFKGVWDAVWKWTSDRITSIRDFIVNTWNDIVSFFTGLGDKTSTAFQSVITFFGGILDFFASLPGKIGSFLLGLPAQLGQLFLNGMTALLEAAKQGLEWLIAWAISLPILVVRALINFGTMLVQWFSDAWTFMTTTAVTRVQEFITWITGLPGRIIDAIIDMGQRFIAWATDSWDALKAQAAIKAQEFITWVTELPGRIIDAIRRFIADFKQWAIDSWNSMRQGAQDRASAFFSWLQGVPGQILSFFSNLGSRMIEIGKDIVRGIWNGIQNLAGWLWNQVTGFVSGIVSKVKSLLSIGSPSKVFADEVGQWIPKGIAQGIDNSASVITDSLRRALNPDQLTQFITPMGKAAQEMLNAVMSDKTFFEDFSFTGMSDLSAQFNDQIAGMFNFAPGGFKNNSRDDVAGFLRNLITAQTTTLSPITTSTVASSNVTIANLNIAGNLDPTNPTQWRQALVNIKDGIRGVERQYQ